MQAGECGEHKPLQSIPFQPFYENTKARQLSPQTERKYSYTLDRKPKDPTIRRRLPVGVSPRQSPRQSSPITMHKRGIVPSTPPNHPSPPIVPQRVSAYLQNCTVPDDYLLKQGKRLSQMLNLTPKKEEKHTFRSLHAAFSKVGTRLKKGRSPSLAENTPQFSPSPTKTKKPLGFPDTPTWKADRSPKSTTPHSNTEDKQYDIAVLAPLYTTQRA